MYSHETLVDPEGNGQKLRAKTKNDESFQNNHSVKEVDCIIFSARVGKREN
jgi:hypothetical protein